MSGFLAVILGVMGGWVVRTLLGVCILNLFAAWEASKRG